jgi:hypothetical protein
MRSSHVTYELDFTRSSGKKALIYNAETFSANQTSEIEQSQKEFNNKIRKL